MDPRLTMVRNIIQAANGYDRPLATAVLQRITAEDIYFILNADTPEEQRRLAVKAAKSLLGGPVVAEPEVTHTEPPASDIAEVTPAEEMI